MPSVQAIYLPPLTGAVLIGVFISCILYGITVLQTWIYIQRYWKTDHMGVKSLVIMMWILETLHMVIDCDFIWRKTIVEFDDPDKLLRTTASDQVATITTGIIIFLAHSFYGWRVWIMSEKNYWLVGIIGVLTVTNFAFDVGTMSSRLVHNKSEC